MLKNGTIVNADASFQGDVLIDNEKVCAIGFGFSEEGLHVIDVSGSLLFPGGIDAHTHLDMPVQNTATSDDFFTGTRAAAFGGTTTIVDYAVQSKGKSLESALTEWMGRADKKAAIDYGFHIAITDVSSSQLKEIPGLVELGVTSFKCFMAYRNSLMIDDDLLYQALTVTKDSGALTCVHAENGYVIDHLIQEALKNGNTEPKYHASTRPYQLEAEATSRACLLARMAEAPLFIVHVSTPAAVAEIIRARQHGQTVMAETCPHYLLFDDEKLSLPGFAGSKYVCSPPIRPKGHQEPLWNHLACGDLQTIGTDHAPFMFYGQKELGRGHFPSIPNGVPGIEERMRLIYTYGVLLERFSLNKMIDLCCAAPAKIFGLYPRKGIIAPGSDADIVVFDPTAVSTIKLDNLHMNCDHTIYEGLPIRGRICKVFSRGEMIVDENEFSAKPGRGKYLKRAAKHSH